MQYLAFGFKLLCCGVFAAALLLGKLASASEVHEVRIARQYGLSYLPLMVMEHEGLLEKRARAAGLGDIKVTWTTFGGGGPINDALLSGNLDIGSGAVGAMATMWSKTRNTLGIKGIAALNSMPVFLNTRNPNIHALKDFTAHDKIALPAVKVSTQATTLGIACMQAFGAAHYNRLDSITVSRSHPDGMIALLSGAGEIDSHFAAPPFQYEELRHPGIHRVLNSYDVLGGKSTFNVVWTSRKFHDDNPKTYQAFVAALQDADRIISTDKRAAAQIYLDMSHDKIARSDLASMLNDPDIEFTTTPRNVLKVVSFMAKTGAIKINPASWKEPFFSNLHGVNGS